MTDPAASTQAPQSPTVADLAAQVAQLQAQLAAAQSQAPAASAAPVAPQPNAFSKGALVSHTWEDDYDGEQTRYGIVVEALADEGAGPHATVAWLAEAASLPESQLEAL